MNDDTPHKPRRLYSPWPVMILLLFFSVAISLWHNHPVWAIVVATIGIFVYGFVDRFRTRMIQEELSLRELFKNW